MASTISSSDTAPLSSLLWRSRSRAPLILCRLVGREPMPLGAAILHVDWLGGRTLGAWHSGQNYFVGGSHSVYVDVHQTPLFLVESKSSDDGAQHSELLDFWTLSIIWRGEVRGEIPSQWVP
jgi:hypothetical protein